MARLLMLAVFIGGLAFLNYSRKEPEPPPPPPPPPALTLPPAPVLAPGEIEKVRSSTKDSDPQVRWAAIELLHRVNDPMALKILQNTLAVDSEPDVRMKALGLLQSSSDGADKAKAEVLMTALKDQEKDIRIAALVALGEVGDPSLAPRITELLKDIDPEVRRQALTTIGRMQEKRRQEYQALVEQLRADYEAAVARSQNKGGSNPLGGTSELPQAR